MTATRLHAEWLSLVEISGSFLTLPVLQRALPHGLEPTDPELVDELRVALTEMDDDPSLAPRFVRWVLSRVLQLDGGLLVEGAALAHLGHRVPEHGVDLRPDLAVVEPDGDGPPRARLLVSEWPAGTALDERPERASWAASPVDRLAELCRATGVRLGVVTNGDTWTLVDAPVGAGTGTATWDAALWLEERSTLHAFTTLLGARRFFSMAEEDTLEALLAQSADAEAEVTDQLGRQVRAAVELLVDALSRSNREQGGAVFAGLTTAQVYEAAVSVLMRLVFLLSAEERGLFLLGDPTYDTTYAVSTLRAQLEEEARGYGEDVLERHTDAWHRLLATFRMVHGGAEHEDMRLPAYGGSLFDPDRFPFLEGRSSDKPWKEASSAPLSVDNRTILHLLDALQVLRFRGRGGVSEARRLSFRSLDVEQIGHVYEGLLDHSVVPVDEVALGLDGKREPELALEEVQARAGREGLVAWLAEQTGLSPKAVQKRLSAGADPDNYARLVSACDNDHALAERVAPYLGLLRKDLRGLPQVFVPGSFVVTQSLDRRTSGTYYTPRALAEEMVTHTLEPLVYSPGPAEGREPEQWQLRPSADLLDLRVCDMAMGSGTFLVAACRYLADRLLEAWTVEGIGPGEALSLPGAHTLVMPGDEVDRQVMARRLVADRCLYGVDRNSMAVEMAKLSLWLV
ncbi:MAG: restriction endonuclease, partial [Actinomycetota bacterium]|nr:restriction endonuclease [Actinomycetota bacterium]